MTAMTDSDRQVRLTKPLAEHTPVEIDTEIMRLDKIHVTMVWSAEAAVRHVEQFKKYIAAGYAAYAEDAEKAERVVENIKVKLAEINQSMEVLEEEYRKRPWTRFVYVPGGHVHRWTGCPTVHPTTQRTPVVENSGMTPEQVVTKHGIVACTVCFPDAPTMPSYQKALAEDAAAQQAKVDKLCAQSGKYASARGLTHLPRYMRCPDCERMIAMTPRFKFRSHARTG